MKLIASGQTNVGRKRAHNEDNLVLVEAENLFVVADGMGGHASGEVASQIAVESISDFFRRSSENDEITWPYKEEKGLRYEENRLVTGIKLSNLRVFETASSDKALKGMGTTIVSALFTEGTAYMGHVGDSRGYRIRDGAIEQVTEDHSLLNDYIKANKLTPEEIEAFPHKNVIVRALGMRDTVRVDISRLNPKTNDIFLLCSDGLSGMVKDPDMLSIVEAANGDMDAAATALIAAANENGGVDNVTVILIKITEA